MKMKHIHILGVVRCIFQILIFVAYVTEGNASPPEGSSYANISCNASTTAMPREGATVLFLWLMALDALCQQSVVQWCGVQRWFRVVVYTSASICFRQRQWFHRRGRHNPFSFAYIWGEILRVAEDAEEQTGSDHPLPIAGESKQEEFANDHRSDIITIDHNETMNPQISSTSLKAFAIEI
ncbi:hypothetical protein L1987_54937 [Smallanthus sonchifolius]|uniref:Uncharacterized protein n=1 Tax=Smallanthus sonchifolius TaxID=185202 RepID=A0ACB9E9K5_9ASTR|nr:hypothetical protein L1987_54937 [Smallanthus sonchifolius]